MVVIGELSGAVRNAWAPGVGRQIDDKAKDRILAELMAESQECCPGPFFLAPSDGEISKWLKTK